GSGGVGGEIELDGNGFGLDVGEPGCEALADGSVVSPEDGWKDSGRWRNVGAADFEHARDKGAGAPVAHAEKAAGLEDARALGGDELGARGEHGAEHGGDGIEGGVAVGESFGVALVEGDGEVLVCGAGAGLLEEIGGDVDAGDDAAAAGER